MAPDVTIGSLNGPVTLSNVAQLLIGSTGDIYITQRNERKISVFSAAGTLLRELGRRGSGPGEFEHLTQIGMFGDTLWAWDRAASRVTFFSTSGDLIRTERVQLQFDPSAMGPIRPQALLADGYWVAIPDINRVLRSGNLTTEIPIVRLLRDGTASGGNLGTLTSSPFIIQVPTTRGLVPLNLRYPQPNGRLVVSPDGSYVILINPVSASSTNPMVYNMQTLAPNGTLLSSRSITVNAPRIPEPTIDRWHTEIINDLVRRGLTRREAESAFADSNIDLPEYLRPFATVVATRDSSVWIYLSEEWDQPVHHWLIFDVRTWDLRGKVDLPRDEAKNVLTLGGTRDYLWVQEIDSLGVVRLVRYRLARDGIESGKQR